MSGSNGKRSLGSSSSHKLLEELRELRRQIFKGADGGQIKRRPPAFVLSDSFKKVHVANLR
eukprot:806357-Amphidinium_carterae.1